MRYKNTATEAPTADRNYFRAQLEIRRSKTSSQLGRRQTR